MNLNLKWSEIYDFVYGSFRRWKEGQEGNKEIANT